MRYITLTFPETLLFQFSLLPSSKLSAYRPEKSKNLILCPLHHTTMKENTHFCIMSLVTVEAKEHSKRRDLERLRKSNATFLGRLLYLFKRFRIQKMATFFFLEEIQISGFKRCRSRGELGEGHSRPCSRGRGQLCSQRRRRSRQPQGRQGLGRRREF